jgi:hypothetical protein
MPKGSGKGGSAVAGMGDIGGSLRDEPEWFGEEMSNQFVDFGQQKKSTE